MNRRRGLAAALALLLLAAGVVIAVAAGGDDDQPSPPAGPSATQAESGDPDGQGEAEVDDEQGPQADAKTHAEALEHAGEVGRIDPPPPIEGGDDSIETFGEEASERQADRIVASLASFLNARAEGDWEAACTLIAGQFDDLISQLAAQAEFERAPVDCASFMERSAANLPRRQLRRFTRVRVGSVRVEDDRGFVVYKNYENRWTAISMVREDGRWKVGSLDGVPLR